MMTSTSALTRSYSCHGKIQEKCCSSKKSSVLLNNLINAQNLIMSEDLMVEQQPRIIILQGRKIVRKKKRQCVKCKFILSFFPLPSSNFKRKYYINVETNFSVGDSLVIFFHN